MLRCWEQETRNRSFSTYPLMFSVSKLAPSARMLSQCSKRLYSATACRLEKFNITVPPMGESIKSGIGCMEDVRDRHSGAVGEEAR